MCSLQHSTMASSGPRYAHDMIFSELHVPMEPRYHQHRSDLKTSIDTTLHDLAQRMSRWHLLMSGRRPSQGRRPGLESARYVTDLTL